MARISGVDLPKNKRIEIGLTYIYGIGRYNSKQILEEAGISYDKKVKDLTDEESNAINKIIQRSYKVEGELRTQIIQDVKRLMEIGCYRGLRHRRNQPVRGQRTKTNAQTRKKYRRSVY